MAGASPTPSANGRRKNLDAELNLVPFIDLLSMCICFLLMTAVWLEIGSIDVKQYLGTDAPTETSSYDVELNFLSSRRAEVRVKTPDKSVERQTVDAENPALLAQAVGGVLEGLARRIGQGETQVVLAKSVSAARLFPNGGVSYGDLVAMMDAFRARGIVNIGVMPVKE